MPWAAAASLAATVAGSAISSSMAPDSSPTGSGGVYQPSGTAQQDTNLQGLLTQNTNAVGAGNPYNTYNPQILQAFQQLFNNPNQGAYQSAAGAAGTGYTDVGNNSINLSNLLSSTSPTALNAGTNVLNMGMDPQNALYAQQLQKTNDQANVSNAQYGLTGQQAAGNVQQADQNFNTSWQENELQRALQGLAGYNQTTANIGTTGTAAQNVGSAGAGSVLAGGETPYAAGNAIGGNQETALTQLLSQLLGPVNSSQGTISNLEQYLGLGVNASAAGSSANLANYYGGLTGAAAGAQGGAALGNSIAGLFNTQASPQTTSGGSSLLPWQQPGYGVTYGYGSGGGDSSSLYDMQY